MQHYTVLVCEGCGKHWRQTPKRLSIPGHNSFGQWVPDEVTCQAAFRALPLVAQAQVRYDQNWAERRHLESRE